MYVLESEDQERAKILIKKVEMLRNKRTECDKIEWERRNFLKNITRRYLKKSKETKLKMEKSENKENCRMHVTAIKDLHLFPDSLQKQEQWLLRCLTNKEFSQSIFILLLLQKLFQVTNFLLDFQLSKS